MSDDNVIPFPKSYRYNEDNDIPISVEELTGSIVKIKETFYDMVSLELAAPIFNRAQLYGFAVDEDEHIKDCILIVESIKSLLMKSKSSYHPLQDHAATMIKYDETWNIFDPDETDESEI